MFFITNILFVFSFFGCILETLFTLAVSNRLMFRKTTRFLPFCPVYGIGALALYYTLTPFKDNPFLVALLGMLVGTAVEYLFGLTILRKFGIFVWDYRNERVNKSGLITPFFSIIWSLLSMLFIYVISPAVIPLIDGFPPILSLFMLIIMLFDLIFTFDMLKKIKQGENPNKFLCPVLKSE